MLRTPMISEIEGVVQICNVSMNTQLEAVGEISKVCERCKIEHYNIISFNLNYFGLLSCMNSPFVKRKYIKV